GHIDEKRLVEEALRGVLKSLKDPYTDYIPAEEYAALERQFKGALTGIGAQLRMVDGRITVLTPLQDSPALKAGLRPGDTIELIDGKPARGLEMAEAIKRIVGAPRTVVKLKVVHADGVVEDLSVTRDQVRIRTVEGFRRGGDHQWQFMLDPQHKVGYARVTQFGGNTGRELREALDGLVKDGMKGLVLDLRFCPGGLLNQAIDVCRMFLKDGTILTVKSPGKGDNVFKADGTGYVGDFPLVILLNDQTASSGEIVAGALRDHDRAVLIGTRSFG